MNGEPDTELNARVVNASQAAGQKVKDAIGPDRAAQVAAAIERLRQTVGQKYQDHWAPTTVDPQAYSNVRIPVISPMVHDYMMAHQPPADIELDEEGKVIEPVKK